MFNIFGKKSEPQPQKPNFIGEQHEHKACLVVFEGTQAVERMESYKAQYSKHTIVNKKVATRLAAMMNSCEQITKNMYGNQNDSIHPINVAKDLNEMIALQMGIMTAEPQGLTICPACLQNAILSCQEVLISLKDIQEATKEYV